jgi:hypothetical protein
MERPCTYCDSDVGDHDPICVRDCDEHCSLVGRFCNFACLTAYVEREGLTERASCEWTPK